MPQSVMKMFPVLCFWVEVQVCVMCLGGDGGGNGFVTVRVRVVLLVVVVVVRTCGGSLKGREE